MSGRVTIHDRQTFVDVFDPPARVGDRYPVVRGNGPREGDTMGVAVVVEVDDDGRVVALDVHFGEVDR